MVVKKHLKDTSTNTLLLLGRMGEGKSTICNRIAGKEANSDAFPTSSETGTCTMSSTFAEITLGDSGKKFSIIDTPGFNGRNQEVELKTMAGIVEKLKNNCNQFHLFGLVINGQSPRLDSLKLMLKTFENTFSEALWKQCVLIFTKIRMDNKSKSMRQDQNKLTDENWADNYVKGLSKMFGIGKVQHVFIDAHFDEEDPIQCEQFHKAVEKLYSVLRSSPAMQTSTLVQRMDDENPALHMAIADIERVSQLEEPKAAENTSHKSRHRATSDQEQSEWKGKVKNPSKRAPRIKPYNL